jgi:hypothetical protein
MFVVRIVRRAKIHCVVGMQVVCSFRAGGTVVFWRVFI